MKTGFVKSLSNFKLPFWKLSKTPIGTGLLLDFIWAANESETISLALSYMEESPDGGTIRKPFQGLLL